MEVQLGTFLKTIIERTHKEPIDSIVLMEQEVTRCPEQIRVMVQHLIPRDALLATFLLKARFIKGHPEVETCGVNITDGKINFFYNEDFIKQFSPSQLLFIIVHEFYHIARLHLDRSARRKLDSGLYNIAGDMIINEDILRDLSTVAGISLEMPVDKKKGPGLRMDKKYAAKHKDPKLWTTESLYQFLAKGKKTKPQKPPNKKDLLTPGRVVRIGKAEDYGIIEKVNKDQTYEVKHISPEEARKRLKVA